MSDSSNEPSSNSKSNLIEVQHVGVTAKLQSPLKTLLPSISSSTETDNRQLLYSNKNNNKSNKYNKFSNVDMESTTTNTTTTDTPKILYEMRTIRAGNGKTKSVIGSSKIALTPSKIEFQLYNKQPRRRCCRRNSKTSGLKLKPAKRRLFDRRVSSRTRANENDNYCVANMSLLQRFRQTLEGMRCSTKRQMNSYNNNNNNNNYMKNKNINHIIFDDLPEPNFQHEEKQQQHQYKNQYQQTTKSDTHIGIYPFEHGCTDHLRTTDCHPSILSVVLADSATRYATRFWAEFFGTIHIGVAFVITFLLQSYRFVLFALVNTLLVGFLRMTSDYFIKPVLTVAFNGFMQPPLILIFNVFSSIRDIFEPIADTVNNFCKPIGSVLRGVRLVHITSNNRKISKSA